MRAEAFSSRSLGEATTQRLVEGTDSDTDDVPANQRSRRVVSRGLTVAVVGVSACAAAAFLANSLTRNGLREASGLHNAVELDGTEGSPTYIQMETNVPGIHLCWDIWGPLKAGAQLQLWTCKDLSSRKHKKLTDFHWLMPPLGATGLITPASNKSLCLDAPNAGNTLVQLWYCATSPSNHIRWTVGVDGRIHLADDKTKCVDVDPLKRGQTSFDGHHLVLTDCGQGSEEDDRVDTQKFVMQFVDAAELEQVSAAPGKDLEEGSDAEANADHDDHDDHDEDAKVSCKWGDWSHWSVCSASCGGGRRFASRRHKVEAEPGGKACEGPSSRSSEHPCNSDACPEKEETFATTTTTTTQGGGGGGWWFR